MHKSYVIKNWTLPINKCDQEITMCITENSSMSLAQKES